MPLMIFMRVISRRRLMKSPVMLEDSMLVMAERSMPSYRPAPRAPPHPAVAGRALARVGALQTKQGSGSCRRGGPPSPPRPHPAASALHDRLRDFPLGRSIELEPDRAPRAGDRFHRLVVEVEYVQVVARPRRLATAISPSG
jgi:hypothetical protein